MLNNKNTFIEFLVASGALRFGDFTTKSGRQSPYFVNTGEFKTGASISTLASFYASTFVKHFAGQADNLFGPAYKGIPLRSEERRVGKECRSRWSLYHLIYRK